jgi:hypothetical protein
MPRPATPEDAMRGFLSGEDPGLARMRRVMRRLPEGPHRRLCAVPFEGPGGAVLRHVGFARFPGNPAICGSCIKGLNKLGVFGAEIAVSLLFADIRGSTGIGEDMCPTEFQSLSTWRCRFLDQVVVVRAMASMMPARGLGREGWTRAVVPPLPSPAVSPPGASAVA